uniref:Uncharacterized protein n=1 Tax=Cacopsylla melanoneura TaxID=428564 RepID=A0A8D9BDG1_9HEMI
MITVFLFNITQCVHRCFSIRGVHIINSETIDKKKKKLSGHMPFNIACHVSRKALPLRMVPLIDVFSYEINHCNPQPFKRYTVVVLEGEMTSMTVFSPQL